MARRNPLVKVVVALVILAGLGFLFLRSVRNTVAEPYEIRQEHVRTWTVVLEAKQNADGALLGLRAPQGLSADLYQQVFARTMVSLVAPAVAVVMPLLLHSEFERSFAGVVSADELAAAARDARLESVVPTPRCLAQRRLEGGREPPQLFFAMFDFPQFDQFREEISRLLVSRAADRAMFDPSALSPVLIIGASNRDLQLWLPLRSDADRECIAPVVVQQGNL